MNNIKFLSMMAGALVLTFASCKKDDLTKDFTSSETQQNGNAKIRFINHFKQYANTIHLLKEYISFGNSFIELEN